MVWIGSVDSSTGRIRPLARSELGTISPNLGLEEAFEPDQITESAILTGMPQVCNDLHACTPGGGWKVEAFQTRCLSAAVLPIHISGEVAGVLAVYAPDPDVFAGRILDLLKQVTADLSFALEMIDQEMKRHRAEEEIRTLNRELEERISVRTSQLAALNTELKRRNDELTHASRMKSDFLAGISHELRTPLHAVAGYIDLLAEEGRDSLTVRQKRFVDHLQRGTDHLLELINDLLDLSKIEAGGLNLKLEWFTVIDALAEVTNTTAPLASAKSIAVEANIVSELCVRADRIRFKQILYNLLSNALKFTPEHGRVWIESSTDHEFVWIAVGDTGVGIAPDEQEAIFNEFHQAAATTRTSKGGTGLGLAITKRLVEAHGGFILVDREPGKGSLFRFTLPLPMLSADTMAAGA
jgi:signal transduction histidine kinase